MDLPTCPACGQSVLDDDAEDCPFCGASMKTGQPGKKPAPAAVSGAAKAPVKGTPAKAAPKPAGKPAESRTAPAEVKSKPGRSPFDDDEDDLDLKTATADDDPFGVGKASTAGAVPLRATPAKGYTLKLTCPMCETVGYATPKAAGKQVKCANPKCLVPLFEAPAPKVEKPVEAPPPPKPRISAGTLTAIVVVLMLAGGGLAAWSMGLFDSKPKTTSITEDIKNLIRENEDGAKTTAGTAQSPESEANPKAADAAKTEPLDALRKQAFDLMIEQARKEQPERGKAVARRLAAVAYARSGNPKAAREQIGLLVIAAKHLPFYPIVPVTTIGWEELKKGQAPAAQAAAKEAWEMRDKLPQFGQDPLFISLDLAALLAAVGRADDAETLVRSREEDVKYGLLSAPLSEVWADRTFDLEKAVANDPILPWTAPHWVAVTKILAARGQWEAALDWSKRHPDPEPKADCLVAWVEAAASHAAASQDAKVLEPLAGALGDVNPAGQARVWGALAARQAALGQTAAAEASLAKAKEALGGLSAPAEFKTPGMKETIDFEPASPVPMRSAAQAAAEIARAEALLNKTEDATKSLDTAIAWTRAIGPGLPGIRRKLADCENAGPSVREQLKTELKLTSDDATLRAFNSYRRGCEKLRGSAEHRRDVQARLLAFVKNTPLRDSAWQKLEASTGSADPLLETPLAWDLADAFKAAGQKAKAAAVEQAIEASQHAPAPEQALKRTVEPLLAEGKADEAAAAIEASEADKVWKDRWTLATCCRLVREGKLETALNLIRGLKKDPIVREEAFELTAAYASRNGKGREIFEAAQMKGLTPPERVSLLQGFVVGSLAGQPSAPGR